MKHIGKVCIDTCKQLSTHIVVIHFLVGNCSYKLILVDTLLIYIIIMLFVDW